MQSKEVFSGSEMWRGILKGVNTLADPVRSSIGPNGINSAIEVPFSLPNISNDALVIAKSVNLEDKNENLGCLLALGVAEKTDFLAKGARSTAVLLFQEILQKGVNLIESGSKQVHIRKGMKAALKNVLLSLKKMTREISSEKEIAQVATISSESEESGALIAKIISEIGKDGVVTVETGGTETTYDIVKGMDFDKGFISPYFVTDPNRQTVELDNALVLVTDKKISSIPDILPLLNKIHEAGEKNVLIIAEDVEGEALATIIVNKMKGIFNIVAVKAPEWGEYKKQLLSDIAFMCQTSVLSQEEGTDMDHVEVENLGRIQKVMVDKEQTVLINDTDVEGRVELLKHELSKETDKVAQSRLKSRIAKLSSGVARIYVGAYSEEMMNYKKKKMEDGVNDAQSALSDGIVPGGGSALALVELKAPKGNKDFNAGYEAVKESLSSPLKQIVDNTGEHSGEVVLNEVLTNEKVNGYNARTEKYVEDMFKEGVVDSFKSTSVAVTNAIEQVDIALTIGFNIVNKKEPEKINSQGQII